MGYDVPKKQENEPEHHASSWSAPLVDAYATAPRPKQDAVCVVLDIPYVVPGEACEDMTEELYFYDLPAAGYANDATNEYEMRSFPTRIVPAGTDFVTSINGDSMEPNYPDHCYVFVEKKECIYNNRVGIFEIADGFVCKRARMNEAGKIIALVSDNPKYKDIKGPDLGQCRVIGEVLDCWEDETP